MSKIKKEEAPTATPTEPVQHHNPADSSEVKMVWYWREEQGQQNTKLKCYPAIVLGHAMPGNYQKADMALYLKVFSIPSEVVKDSVLFSEKPQAGRWTFKK